MSAVPDSKHVVLIHGTWADGDMFGDARREFEARGYTVHTPTLPVSRSAAGQGQREDRPVERA
jgi:hypothetical protein